MSRRSRFLAWIVLVLVSGLPGRAVAASRIPTGFQVRNLSVKGARCAYAVYLPPGYDRQRAWPCIVFLNGSGECGTDGEKPTRMGLGPALLAHPERWPFVVLLPQKPRDDEEWVEHEDLVFAALQAARKAWHIDPDRVALTGISQGGYGAWLIAARHPDQWSCLVPVCGYGRAHTTASRIWKLPIWAFQGLKDDIVDPREPQAIVAAVRERQKAAGLAEGGPGWARLTLYPDQGHGCWDAAYGDSSLAAWMLEQRRAR